MWASFLVLATLGNDDIKGCRWCEALTVCESAMAFPLTVVIIGGVASLVGARRE